MTALILLKNFGPALEVSISKSLLLLRNPRIIRRGYGLAGASVAARRRGRPVVASRATRRRMVALRDASGSSSLLKTERENDDISLHEQKRADSPDITPRYYILPHAMKSPHFFW